MSHNPVPTKENVLAHIPAADTANVASVWRITTVTANCPHAFSVNPRKRPMTGVSKNCAATEAANS